MEADNVKSEITPPENTEEESVFREKVKAFFLEMAMISYFALRFFKELPRRPFEFREIVRQCYVIGYRSLPLVGITGFIMGLVLTIQSGPTLAEFGAESWLPAMVAVSIIREIGPVITALICAGKIGSSIGAELGSMKVTEQIDAMQVSSRKPFKYLAVTRILASTLMIPLLVIFSDGISLMGSFAGCNLNGEVSFQLFFSKIFEKLVFSDIWPAFIKTVFFGFAIGLVACYKGFNSAKGTEGVGNAANSAVVTSSLLIFIIDMVAVQLTSLFL